MAGQSWTVHNIGKRIMFGEVFIAGHARYPYDVPNTTRLHSTKDSYRTEPYTYLTGGPNTLVSGYPTRPGGSWSNGKDLAVSWRYPVTFGEFENYLLYFRGKEYTLVEGSSLYSVALVACSIRRRKVYTDYQYEVITYYRDVTSGLGYYNIFGFSPKSSTLHLVATLPSSLTGSLSTIYTGFTSNGRGQYTKVTPEASSYSIGYAELSDDLTTEHGPYSPLTVTGAVGWSDYADYTDYVYTANEASSGSELAASHLLEDGSYLFYEVVTELRSRLITGSKDVETTRVVYRTTAPTVPVTLTYESVTQNISLTEHGYVRLRKITPVRASEVEPPSSWEITTERSGFDLFSWSATGSTYSPLWTADGVTESAIYNVNPGPWNAGNPAIPYVAPTSPEPSDPPMVVTGYSRYNYVLIFASLHVEVLQKYRYAMMSNGQGTSMMLPGHAGSAYGAYIEPITLSSSLDGGEVSLHDLSYLINLYTDSGAMGLGASARFYRDTAIANKSFMLFQGSTIQPQVFYMTCDLKTGVSELHLGSIFAPQYSLTL